MDRPGLSIVHEALIVNAALQSGMVLGRAGKFHLLEYVLLSRRPKSSQNEIARKRCDDPASASF
jgi:hypothetical protein